ncbi:MAG: ATP-binding protein [Acetatifactor sp.]|nr:ATP-binding protein [Acetatifactor sp.]
MSEEFLYIMAYYRADRIFKAEQPKHVEKVQLKDNYEITEFPRNEFVKYLLDLKMTEALARNSKKTEKADEIQTWFENLEQLLKRIFADESVELAFDEDTFRFHILQQGKEPFDFNTLSSGYQAVLDIVLDVMMRMVNQTQRSFDFTLPGIVLIDEIETHLHLELQKSIMPLLITIFPNIQFVVTTHSPFILNSLENVVVYDLENHILVENGMNNLPYEGIVEGYFRADRMSDELNAKFERYRELVQKEKLSDDEISEIAELELYLDEIPDYLAIDITTEYQRLKLEYMHREDIDG